MMLCRYSGVVLALLVLNLSLSTGVAAAEFNASATSRPPPPQVRAAAVGAEGDPTRQALIDQTFGRMPLYFVENRGQLDGRVGYYLQGQTAA